MSKIKVLVVDDAVVVRSILTSGISADPELEVIGTAANGRLALEKIDLLKPDIVTLDVEMPEMNGIETLKVIKKTYPKLPVIMFSTLTERGASITLEALSIGASDYVAKPANVGSVTQSKEAVNRELIGKIKSLALKAAESNASLNQSAKVDLPETFKRKTVKANHRPEIIAIGVSTGGPNALAELLATLPHNINVPVVIVQHMPPLFTRMLAERLASNSKVKVHEAKAGMILEPNNVYLAPGDFHMELEKNKAQFIIKLHQGPHENSCRPAVDVLFRSVANHFGDRALAIVLTGMGSDGLSGCKLMAEKGASIICQDRATSVVWGMPGYVTQAGLADKVLPLKEIPTELFIRLGMEQAKTSHKLQHGDNQ